MTATQQQPGIRTRLWVAGKFSARDPVPIQLEVQRHEAKTRVSNLGLRMDRPRTTAGLPNIRNRHEVTLPWATIQESELLEHLDTLTAIGQPFDLGLWKHTTDVWDGDGTTKDFLLQRRPLIPNVTPPTEWEHYPTRVFRLDKPYGDPTAVVTPYTYVPKTSANINSGSPAASEAWLETDGHRVGGLWVSTLRVGTAPPDVSDCLHAIYMPLYRVTIDQEIERSYSAGMIEPRGYRLIEG